ncbi:MAG: hypothetical protein KC425_23080 [Anaerolineales bacterium]|nr:hypothetical protein [Anaerolineales bacterium]
MRYARAGNWPVVLGYALFTGMMAVGYWYNVTFVQLGLTDLGERRLGLPGARVAGLMALLALLTCGVALAAGLWLQRGGRATRLRLKLRLALGVVVLQTGLTLLAPRVASEAAFIGWIAACALALGVGVPVTFSLTTDLIPVGDRGYVAAAVTALAYFAAAVWTTDWRIEPLARQMLWVMVPGALALAPLALLPLPFVDELARNHRLARFAHGRFVRGGAAQPRMSRRFVGALLLMFGIYFVDSLGFLRIVATPDLIGATWQAPEALPRLMIGGVHVGTAVLAGVLYTHVGERPLFAWVLGLFALAHLMYTFPLRLGSGGTLAEPMLYATAVSLYTVLNFAIWADLSTPQTISRNAALGVALSGWTATFVSTAVAIRWQASGMAAVAHLRLVDALAVVLFVGLLLRWVLPGVGEWRAGSGERGAWRVARGEEFEGVWRDGV